MQKNKLLLSIPVLMLCTGLNLSIVAQLKVSAIQYTNEKDYNKFSFPFFEGPKLVVDKINYKLQTDILDCTLKNITRKKLFDNTRYISSNDDSIGQSGFTDISFTTILNNSKLVSIQFAFESMGAYPEGWQEYYNFETATGKLITEQTLFTPAGRQKISKLLIEKRKTLIKSWIAEMDTMYNVADDSAWIAERFAECNNKAELDKISVRKNSIVFYKRYCFPHMARPYDIDLDIELPLKLLLPYLSDTGRKLLQ